MSTNAINGTLWILTIDGEPLGYQKDATLSIEIDTPEITNKTSGGWAEFIGTKKSWSIEADAVFINQNLVGEKDFSELFDIISTNSSVLVRFTPSTVATGDIYFEGNGIIKSISVNAPVEDAMTVSVSIQGTGQLNKVVVP